MLLKMLGTVCITVFPIAVLAQRAPTDQPVPLKLGGLFPMSGSHCVNGLGALFGAQTAVKAINSDDSAFGDSFAVPNMWKQWGTNPGGGQTALEPFHMNVSMDAQDSQSSKSNALWVTDGFIHSGVDIIIGSLLSEVTEQIALLAKYDKIPVVSYASPMPKLTSADMDLSTFVRTHPSNKAVMKAAIDVVHNFEWEGCYLITTNDEEGVDTASEFNYWAAEATSALGEDMEPRIEFREVIYVDDELDSIRNKLETIKTGKWRIIILHAEPDMAMKILHVAKTLNMVKMGWVWIGTEWATDSSFVECVWPQVWSDGTASDSEICVNMTGFTAEDSFCTNNLGDSCVHKLSDDGTAGYLSKDSDNDGLIDLSGLIAVRVHPLLTASAAELQTIWIEERAGFIQDYGAQCPQLTLDTPLNRLAFYAFDAVLAATKGAADLFECGTVVNRADSDCGRLVENWAGESLLSLQNIGYAMMTPADCTGLNCSFETGTSSMFDSLERIEIENGASGDIGFIERLETIDGGVTEGGDPETVVLEIVNFRESADGTTGEYIEVGQWMQSRASESCPHGHCGRLLPHPADDQDTWEPVPEIIWMGGLTNIPSDRVVDHNAAEAQYFLLVLCALILSLWGGSVLELLHFHYIPEAGLTCIIGMGVGGLVKLHVAVTHSHEFEELAYFDEGVFALVLLPIIIFDAGFGAKKTRFFGNIGPIMTCALFGTTISTFIVGTGMKVLGEWGWSDVKLAWFESFTFGALISAVDPVATLAVFGALKVETNLNYRVFGESIINDAVSIVLFRVFAKYMVEPWDGVNSMASAFVLFLKIGLGSVAMGIVVALIASLVLKVSHIHDPLLACGVFILSSYCAYELTEALHLSGIIASLFAGFCMRNYALINIMEQYREMVLDMVHMLAAMSDLVIFFMVGENVILYMPYDKWWMILWTIVLCLVGRIFNIFPLCGIYNLLQKTKKKTITLSKSVQDASEKMLLLTVSESCSEIEYKGVTEGRGKPSAVSVDGFLLSDVDGDPMTPSTLLSATLGYTIVSVGDQTEGPFDIQKAIGDSDSVTAEIEIDKRVSMKNQIVMFHSGLRGAIAFALALGFPSQHRKYIIDTTTWVILFTVFVMGGTTVPLLNVLNIPLGCAEDPPELKMLDGEVERKKVKTGESPGGILYRFLEFEAFVKRLITREPADELGVFALTWDDMTEEQQQAALTLGYTNDPDSAKVWPAYSYAWGTWYELSDDKKAAAVVLGLHEFHWPPPDFSIMGQADDLVKQHKSGHDTAYDEASLAGSQGNETTNPLDDEEGDDEEEASDSTVPLE